MSDERIGAILRDTRIASGMTIQDLGRATGVNWHSIARYEHGVQSIPGSFVYKAAKCFGVPVGTLFGEGGGTLSEESFGAEVPSLEEVQALARMWRRIPDPRIRLATRMLIACIARSSGGRAS